MLRSPPKRIPKGFSLERRTHRGLTGCLVDNRPDPARINRSGDQSGAHAANVVNASKPVIAAYHVLQRSLDVIAPLQIS
jgi:hypothetical protein